MMRGKKAHMSGALLVGLFLLGGCTNQEAYIYKEDEFNRNSPTFNKEPKDRDSVQICYSRFATNVDELLQMASSECGKYGKTAKFAGHDYLECPVTTPARATFACLKK